MKKYAKVTFKSGREIVIDCIKEDYQEKDPTEIAKDFMNDVKSLQDNDTLQLGNAIMRCGEIECLRIVERDHP